jgi:malate dehydrogenase (oxaloacetate-decarboxylating)
MLGSATAGVAVARAAVQDGVAQADLTDPIQAVQDALWRAAYQPLDRAP